MNIVLNPPTNSKMDRMGEEVGKIFVGGVSRETTIDAFRAYFESFGQINDIVLMMDKDTRMNKGYGFVKFEDPRCSEDVLGKKGQHQLDGKMLDTKPCNARGSKPRGGGGGGGGGQDDSRTKKVFVGGISQQASKDDLYELFKQFGMVEDVHIMTDNETGKHRGFGFVTLDSEEDVEKLVGMQHLELKGKSMEIKKAQPKMNRGFGGPGGPMGGGGFQQGGGGGFNQGGQQGYGGGYGGSSQWNMGMGRVSLGNSKVDISRGVVQDRGMVASNSRGTTMVTAGNKDRRELGMVNRQGVMDSSSNNNKHNSKVMEESLMPKVIMEAKALATLDRAMVVMQVTDKHNRTPMDNNNNKHNKHSKHSNMETKDQWVATLKNPQGMDLSESTTVSNNKEVTVKNPTRPFRIDSLVTACPGRTTDHLSNSNNIHNHNHHHHSNSSHNKGTGNKLTVAQTCTATTTTTLAEGTWVEETSSIRTGDSKAIRFNKGGNGNIPVDLPLNWICCPEGCSHCLPDMDPITCI